jgi:hypothetical protein
VPSGRIHDTARGPDGPCSVAAQPDGHIKGYREASSD